MAARVHLRRPMSLTKARLLAPFSARQRARLALRGLPPELLLVVDHCVLSEAPGYLYVKNAKAACSTVTKAIHLWQAGWAPERRIHVAPDLVQGWRAYERVAREIADPGVLRFTFVREPSKRVVSGFLYYFADRKAPLLRRHEPLIRAFGYDPEGKVERNFDAFLDYVEAGMAEDVARTDIHFRPQVHNLRPDLVDYGFVGRVENLAADLARLEERLGIPAERRLAEVPRTNEARSAFSPSPAQAARLRDLYAADYEAFGY